MKALVILAVLAALSLLGGGCASIVKGTTQAIPVASSPAGADIRIDGNKVGQTPTKVEVKRKADHLMTIEKPGYETETFAITRNIGGAVFGNIIAGGLVGWGVDAISGAQWNLTPETVNVTLRPASPATDGKPAAAPSSAAHFIEELKKLDELHASKQITNEEYAKMRTSLVDKYSKT